MTRKLVALGAVVLGLLLGATTAGAVPASPDLHTVPAPYSTLRWRTSPEVNGHPQICVGNHSSDTWQHIFNGWDAVTNDVTLYYRYGEFACSAWPNDSKIDVYIGGDTNQSCSYVYKAWDSSGKVTRTILYLNHSLSQACWFDTPGYATDREIRSVDHWKSQGLGLALGNLKFDSGVGYWEVDWESVMDTGWGAYSYNTPYAATGDGRTFDWFN